LYTVFLSLQHLEHAAHAVLGLRHERPSGARFVWSRCLSDLRRARSPSQRASSDCCLKEPWPLRICACIPKFTNLTRMWRFR